MVCREFISAKLYCKSRWGEGPEVHRRRPVSKEEVDGIMKFAALAYTHDGESTSRAAGLAMRAAIMSPEFLFRMERNP